MPPSCLIDNQPVKTSKSFIPSIRSIDSSTSFPISVITIDPINLEKSTSNFFNFLGVNEVNFRQRSKGTEGTECVD